ncbi:AI-2 transport protein TqsA [bacterium BMS3Abin07]|nr:AI-2 transport protein TqsA [bacterium BMS3Abin07]GBE33169.1 AI-2 transport protein TqsA [bacterium BMS3Bbin05]HDL19763.1 AI-2E family transporter [Nitrospirota bacterium]HDO21908.1 AI-2E family transporter [Nitrospirota bacterium]HDZ88457.1 AI-2E family transporter [Nitrospirota bacterium]
MNHEAKESSGPGILITMAAFIVVVAGLRVASPILIPLLLSAFIAVISSPPLFWLKRKGVPTIIAMIIVISAVLILVLLIAALIGTSLDDFSRNLPLYQERLREKTNVLLAWIGHTGFDISIDKLYEVFNPSIAMRLVTKMLSGLSGVLTNGFLILFTVIFILLEASSFSGKLQKILTDPAKSLAYFDKFMHNVQSYMVIKTLVSIGTGIAVAIWLAVLGVDFPLLWGLLAFLLNYIPNIGSILAAIPAVLLAFIQLGKIPAILTIAGYVTVNIVIGNFVEPKLMGRGLGLSTLVVFLSLIFWGWVFGPVGMLLSVPLTMTLKIALDSKEDTRWLAILMGEMPHKKPEQKDIAASKKES